MTSSTGGHERLGDVENLPLFRQLVENASDAIGMSAPDGRHYYQNASFTAMFGEVGENPPQTLYVDHEVGAEVFRTIMAGGQWVGEVEMYARDGRILNILLRAFANKNERGKIVSLVGVHTDVTARRQAEEALQASEKTFRSVIQSSPMGVYLYRLEEGDRLVFFGSNAAADRMVGMDNSRFIGLTIEEAFPPLANTELPERYRRAARDGESWHTETVHYDYGGIAGAFEVFVFQIAPNQATVMFSEVTERKRAEAEREQLLAQLNQSQKMESLGRLAGGVAHDFNNMLGVILGHAEMAMEQVDAGHPLFEDIQAIRHAAERSAGLTRQLLAFARKQSVAPKVLDLNETVEGLLKMLRRLIGEDIDLAWRPGNHLGFVTIDPAQVDQILANLCVNARDAIEGGGSITIETQPAAFDEAYCASHAGFVPGNYVMLAVSDDGCGMDQRTQSMLFEPFFTTKELGRGTGLGLATVYGIVKQNNGFIHVTSKPGHGSTFQIYIPRETNEGGRPASTGRPDVRRGRDETVLLVEDEFTVLRIGSRMLANLGYSVLEASTPEQAMQVATARAGQIHLLLTDIVMPGMNGRELAHRLHALYPNMKILFMSGYAAGESDRGGAAGDAVSFIQKPFTLRELSAKVREELDRP